MIKDLYVTDVSIFFNHQPHHNLVKLPPRCKFLNMIFVYSVLYCIYGISYIFYTIQLLGITPKILHSRTCIHLYI